MLFPAAGKPLPGQLPRVHGPRAVDQTARVRDERTGVVPAGVVATTPTPDAGFLPDFGQTLAMLGCPRHHRLVPGAQDVEADLVAHLVASTGLAPEVARRVVEDVVAFHAEPVADYVRRRHAYLKTLGARNPEIFAQISDELAHRVVAAPRLTERQLRRLVYG